MLVIQDAIMAFFASIGIFALLWMLTGVLVRPSKVTPLVVYLSGKHGAIIAQIRALRYLRVWGIRDLQLVILQDSITPSQVVELEPLLQSDPAITIGNP